MSLITLLVAVLVFLFLKYEDIRSERDYLQRILVKKCMDSVFMEIIQQNFEEEI